MTQTSQSGLTAKFPPATIHSALGVAQAVKDLSGSGSPITRAMIAQKMGVSAKSGSFEKRMASARIYGMIGGKGVYELSAAGKRYFSPANEGEKQQAMATFMAEPPYFGQAIKNLNGKAASLETATGAMGEIGVPAAERNTVARSFLNSASAAGLIDASGHLHAQGGHKPMASSRRGRTRPAGGKPAAKGTTKKAAAPGGKKGSAPSKSAAPTKAATPAKPATSAKSPTAGKAASPAKSAAPAKAATPAKPAAPAKAATPAKASAPAKASTNGRRRRRRRGTMGGQAPAATTGRASTASAPKIAPAAARPLAGPNVWIFTTGNDLVKVETSSNLSPALWQKLASYVEVLKPVRS